MNNQYISKSNQVISLINDIKSIRFQDLELLKKKCDLLNTLAEKNNDLYGIAFSHMYLAHYTQINQKDDDYKFHSEKAKKISEENQFLDILIEYYKLACIYYTESGDDLSSFSACLQGLEIAIKVSDYEACAALNNNIGEAFFQSDELDNAEHYFLKALDDTSKLKGDRPKYKDLILMNIVDLFIQKKDIEKAKYWLIKNKEYGHDTNLINAYTKRSEICILVLENKIEEAFEKIKQLRKFLDSEDPMLFIHIYLYLTEVLLDIKEQEYASWCLHILLSLVNDVNTKFKLKIYAYRVKYCELFNIVDDDAYLLYYETSLNYKEIEKTTNYENLNDLIQLHYAKQNQDKMMKVEENLQMMADIDELTNVFNRRYFSKLLTKYMFNEHVKTLGIIMIDIDHFKEYNDNYGHIQGDGVLRAVANTLTKNAPEDIFVSRFGGDEFACICINKTNSEIISFIENVHSTLKQLKIEHKAHKSNDYITLSIGFYNGTNREKMLEKADDALYKAKALGRNTYYPRRQKIISILDDSMNKHEQLYFIERYNEAQASNDHYALVQINIKNFRYYNTKYGYKEGDELLALVYETLNNWLQENEYATRIYSDNFAVLLKYDDIDTLIKERLNKSIDLFYRIEDPRIHRNLFLTYGVYEIVDTTTTFQEAWNAATLVRRETASPTKRNSSLELYNDSYKDAFLERMQLEVDIADAYKNYEFIPFYQPKVDAKTHEIIGAEALLRWYDDAGNLVPLYKFLPILNENSYINLIDLYIFEITCKMLDERIKSGRPVVPISFNISKSYFYDDNMVNDYISVFERFNVPKDLIEIELMETISLDDTERLKKVIQDFNNYGFNCLLDDFGNGYSSFNVLLNNQLSGVKIDRQFFMKNLNGDNKLIIQTVVNLIKSLHMKVIAEGVETKEYADLLASCGCDAIQGFYFYQPMPLKKFYTLINRVK